MENRLEIAPVPGFGAPVAVPGAMRRPDPDIDYRVVFAITRASAEGNMPNPALVRVARFVNLMAEEGIVLRAGAVVASVSGPATRGLIADGGVNAALVEALCTAGVTVAVCGQALHHQAIDADELVAGVEVDLSAITTLATLQRRGWSLIPD